MRRYGFSNTIVDKWNVLPEQVIMSETFERI